MSKGEITPWVDPEKPVEAELLDPNQTLVVYKGSEVVLDLGNFAMTKHSFRIYTGQDGELPPNVHIPAIEASTHHEIEGIKE